MAKLSIIIPSRNEQFLSKTVDDIFAKARGEFEVIVILDEKEQYLEPREGLIVRQKDGPPGLRSAMNQAIATATGKYIMKTDGHCMFDEGFDEVFKADCDEDWVVIPRRYSLLPEEWERNFSRPIIDYEYFVFPWVKLFSVKTGGKWYKRAEDRKELLIDDEMAFQGSCWFTNKAHIERIGGFSIESSTGDQFVLESEEMANKTWLSGGKVVVNKKTWYAHLHKGSRYGRGYFINKWPMKRQRIFHNDYWMHDRWPKATKTMKWLIEQFMPIPGWPEDWEDPKYEQYYKEVNGL